MTDLALYITWKNYSSWSLRAWLLMRALEIPFEEILVPMTDEARLSRHGRHLADAQGALPD